MRVMLDTNVLLSALFFSGETLNKLMHKITAEHQLVLSSDIINELLGITRRKFPDKISKIEIMLSQLPYELVSSPEQPEPGLFEIRDVKDYPILYSAILGNVDAFVTGDNDFSEVDLKKPKIITPAEFIYKY